MGNRLVILAALFVVLALFGCTQANTANSNSTNATQNLSGGMSMVTNPTVVFETTKGTFKAEIFLRQAPITAGNFLGLVNSGFYNNLTFHRYVPDFVIQGGDPKGDGTGGSNKTIPLEIAPGLTHNIGALGMARSSDPDSASSQFYVVIGPAHGLDGQYAVFGNVTEGMDVVYQLRQGDRMTKVYVQQ
jgi:peptidyl-prolyl cis-trans isomerase B (cyclophilin B)